MVVETERAFAGAEAATVPGVASAPAAPPTAASAEAAAKLAEAAISADGGRVRDRTTAVRASPGDCPRGTEPGPSAGRTSGGKPEGDTNWGGDAEAEPACCAEADAEAESACCAEAIAPTERTRTKA